jgi:hypothetical protein
MGKGAAMKEALPKLHEVNIVNVSTLELLIL